MAKKQDALPEGGDQQDALLEPLDTPPATTTVRMVRDPQLNPTPHTADVHPDEVGAWAGLGWNVA